MQRGDIKRKRMEFTMYKEERIQRKGRMERGKDGNGEGWNGWEDGREKMEDSRRMEWLNGSGRIRGERKDVRERMDGWRKKKEQDERKGKGWMKGEKKNAWKGKGWMEKKRKV